MTTLSRNIKSSPSLGNGVTVGPLKELPERVMQFGEGNFLRAFVDWQFNELNSRGMFNGRIVIIQPLPNGMVGTLNQQEGLYTLVQRGYQEGKLIERTDIITSVSRGINPYVQYDEFLKSAVHPDLRFVISNTTESGIAYVKSGMPDNTCPASFPAKVAVLLFERFKKFGADPSKGLIIIPCELIDRNGDELKKCVLQHAGDWNCGQNFIHWIDTHNYFYNTLVDRIVPGFPKDEIGELTKKLGYDDGMLVACEVFHKWVIQGDPIAQRELPFTNAGLNVIWTDDITPHRTLKVRILNGAHTTFTIPAFLAGKEFVKESMEDAAIGAFIRSSVFDEILPTLDFPQKEKEQFASDVLERFRNPFIKHALISITLNAVSKYKVRVLPSLIEYHRQRKNVPKNLSVGLAALIRFYKPAGRDDRGFTGEYNGRTYPIQDSIDVVEYFDTVWKKYETDYRRITDEILAHQAFWDTDLRTIGGLDDAVAAHLKTLETVGINALLK